MRRVTSIILWCEGCGVYYRTTEEGYTGLCAKCGSPSPRMRCTRCGAKWELRDLTRLPGTCPGCCSYLWDRERTKAMPRERMARATRRSAPSEVADPALEAIAVTTYRTDDHEQI